MRFKIFLMLLCLIFSPLCFAWASEENLEECHFSTKRLEYALDTEEKELNHWDMLPEELCLQIFDNLNLAELSIIQPVCKHWYQIAKDEIFSPSYLILKRPLKILARKIGQHEGALRKVRQEIDSCMGEFSIRARFYSSPDALHKSLLTPFAARQLLRTPKLTPLLFESNITAKEIYLALETNILDEELQKAIKRYTDSMPVSVWQGSIFTKEFVDLMQLHLPYFKAFYFLSLYSCPGSNLLLKLLKQIFEELENPLMYVEEYEASSLYLPQAMINLEMSPSGYNKIGMFCHFWRKNSFHQVYQRQWQAYEETFLKRAAVEGLSKAQFKFAKLLHKKGALEEAEDFYRQAASQGKIKAYFYLGDVLIEQSKYKQAEEIYRHNSIRFMPEAQRMLRHVLLMQVKVKDAKEVYIQAANCGHASAQYERGNFLLLQGKI
ncbi:MAG: F-box/SEL1-like repeat protein [Alphaproteobacteria bacterium]|nr:F-box/SEL1-like repeat protein [Alphaproteobacteria bacterium]